MARPGVISAHGAGGGPVGFASSAGFVQWERGIAPSAAAAGAHRLVLILIRSTPLPFRIPHPTASPGRRAAISRRFHVLLAILLAALAVGCREEGDALRTERVVALPEAVGAGASLRVDGRGRLWVVEAERATVVDTGKAPRPSRITVGPGTPLPAPVWDAGGRLYVDRGAAALAELRRGGGAALPRALRSPGPVARDPGGRWIYAVWGRRGGVVGMTADSLRPSWGWPETGSPAGALAVGPLGDRVYLALDADEAADRGPRIEVRDAQTGRALSSLERPEPVRALAALPDGTLLGVAAEEDGGSVFALRHGPQGLVETWSVSLARLGITPPVRLRVSPAGGRLAVFSAAAEGGGGLRVLDQASGRVAGETGEAPLDAAFDAAGRLHLLTSREVRTTP